MIHCCGHNRETEFCPDCGKFLGNWHALVELKDLLLITRNRLMRADRDSERAERMTQHYLAGPFLRTVTEKIEAMNQIKAANKFYDAVDGLINIREEESCSKKESHA